jgi:hypothetical protein
MTTLLKMVRVLMFTVVLVAATNLIILPHVSGSELGSPEEGERQLLHLFGKKILNSTGVDWPLEPGVTAHAIFEGERLAALKVMPVADGVWKGEDTQAPCCLTAETYGRLLDLVSRFRSIGEPEGVSPFGVIGPSGWSTNSKRYANAVIVRFEKTCAEAEGTCGVAHFTVYYWLPVEGKLAVKRVRDVTLHGKDGEVLDHRLQYFLRINRTEIEVSEADYSQVREGECLRVERLLTNALGRVYRCGR